MGGWPFVQKRLGNVEEAKDKDKKLLCDPQKLLHTVRNTDFLFKNYFEQLKNSKRYKKFLTDFARFCTDFLPILVRYLVQFREFFISIWQFT